MRINLFKKIAAITATMFLLVSTSMALAISCATCSGGGNLTTKQAVECGTSCASGSNQDPAQATTSLNKTIIKVINLLSVFVGIAAVIMIIIGGFRYVTSGGKQEAVAGAKNTILYAIIGLVVVALAQVIARFVLTNVTK